MYNRYTVNKLHKLMQVRFAGFYGNYVLLLIEHNISTCNKKKPPPFATFYLLSWPEDYVYLVLVISNHRLIPPTSRKCLLKY